MSPTQIAIKSVNVKESYQGLKKILPVEGTDWISNQALKVRYFWASLCFILMSFIRHQFCEAFRFPGNTFNPLEELPFYSYLSSILFSKNYFVLGCQDVLVRRLGNYWNLVSLLSIRTCVTEWKLMWCVTKLITRY